MNGFLLLRQFWAAGKASSSRNVRFILAVKDNQPEKIQFNDFLTSY